MRRANIEVANWSVDMDSRDPPRCYPWRSFYPLSSVLTTKRQRITKTCFRTSMNQCQARFMALNRVAKGNSGSGARLVGLAVKPAFAFALSLRFPSGVSRPLCASDTFSKATAPVKLPTRHCPNTCFLLGQLVRFKLVKGRCFIGPHFARRLRGVPPTLHSLQV